MFAANNSQPPLETNVIYIEDKPPKIVQSKKSTKGKLSLKKGIEKKIISRARKSGVNLKKTLLKHNIKKEKENNSNEHDEQERTEHTDRNDPLFMPQLHVKCELHDEVKIETNRENEESDVDKDCLDDGQEYEMKDETKMAGNNDSEYEECHEERFDIDDDEDDEDDEPLILLTQTSSGKMRKKKKKIPRLHNCRETCKHKCTIKYTKRQRIDIFDYYCCLSQEDKINFIRQHIRKPVLTRIRNRKRGNNCCYFLKYYKIGIKPMVKPTELSEETSNVNNNNNDNDNTNNDLTKVCRKFFEGTLGISNREIKEAIEGYELQHERVVRPLRDIIKEEQSKLIEKTTDKPQRPQQFLDPETGNLSDTKPKKKTKRRKPGDPEPERFPRPINCAIRCTFKCHQNFSEEERKQICDIFWSLDFKRRKDFILARIETKDVETPTTPEFRKTDRPTRAYQTRFYLRSGLNSENKRVCKHFMMSTLCINRKFIENAIKYADKTTGNYTGVDGRGKHLIHKISPERKQAILDHINSYPVWMPSKKSKLRCLHYSLSIKRMYKEYREKCSETQIKPVSAFYYYKVFHDEFRLLFLSNKESKKGRGFLNINPNISHYTGEEPGGSWLDSKGNQLDLRYFNPGECLKPFQVFQQPSASVSCSSVDSTPHNINQSQASTAAGVGSALDFSQSLNFATAAAAQHLANFVDTSTSLPPSSLNPRAIFQTTVQNLYGSSSLPQSSVIEPDNDVEQPMGDSSKTPTEEEIDKSGELRSQAAAAYSEQKYQQAIDLYTQAIEINPGNALFHAKRGQAFLKLQKPNACIRDCNKALEINCDSAAAYKFRGRANRLLGNWAEAAKDLRQACKLDYDEEADEWLREVTPNAKKIEQHHLKQQRKAAERERKAEEVRRQKARQQQKTSFSTGFESGGFPGGAGGVGGLHGDHQTDDFLSAIKDPEVMAALQDIATNPANIEKHKSNPKIAKLVDYLKNSVPGGIPGFSGLFPGAANGAGATPPPSSGKTNEPKQAPKKPDFVDDGLD